MGPTWDNGRIGPSYLAKRLDRFFIFDNLLVRMGRPISHIINSFIFDHRPITLQWGKRGYKKGLPYKFNRVSLEDEELNDLVKNIWSANSSKEIISPSQHLLDKLHELKIRDLEKKRHKLLGIEEATWRLKIRALWLKEGDRDTKFFHRFTNNRTDTNLIWDIQVDSGNKLFSQEEISKEAVSYFGNFYKRNDNINNEDIIWGIAPFPSMFDDDQNNTSFQPISKNELFEVMKSFKRDKSPGPDGWTIEFYIHFFDLLKKDILAMVEELRMRGSFHPHFTSTYITLIAKKKKEITFLDFRLISLCNAIYKISSKIITNRIRGILSNHIS
eukprot:PITA_18078